MRKIYQRYFEIPEENEGIMGERVFFARLAVSIACIVLCMSAMGFTAYAFFTANVTSSMNQIQAASFDLEVQEIKPQTGTSSASYESEKTYKLQAGSVYKFKLVKNGNASTGYCQIMIMKDETTESVYTRQFGKSKLDESPVDTRTIQIKVQEETIVKFVPCWGTYSRNDALDEQAKMIAVKEGMLVTFEDMPTPQAISETVDTVDTSPDVTSEPSATITPSTLGATDTVSATSTEPTTPTETTTPVEPTTPTDVTTSNEDTAPEAEEKKEDTIAESTEAEENTATESTEPMEENTSAEDTLETKTQE